VAAFDGLPGEALIGPAGEAALEGVIAGLRGVADGAAAEDAAGDGSAGVGSTRAIPASGWDGSSLDRVKKKIAAVAVSRRRTKAIGRERRFMIGRFIVEEIEQFQTSAEKPDTLAKQSRTGAK
jgi:hypothetical protein